MPKSNYEQFRALLRVAIGSVMQAEFAKKANISAEHLNRMLNAKEIHRPSMQTLISIAENASNGVTLQDMIDALDNADPNHMPANIDDVVRDIANEEAARDFAPSFDEIANDVFSAVKQCVSAAFDKSKVCCVSDLNDFMIRVVDNYNHIKKHNIDIFYDIEIERQYFGHIYDDVTHYAVVNLNIINNYSIANSNIVLYLSHLPKSDDIIIQHANMEMDHIIELYGFPRFLMKKYEKQGMDEEEAMQAIHALPYFADTRQLRSRTPGGEKRLLAYIFKEDTDPVTYKEVVVYGFGFHIDDVPEKFNKFVENHKMSILEEFRHSKDIYVEMNKQIQALIDKNADSRDFADLFENYYNDAYGEEGWRAIISAVMRRETSFAFTLHSEAADENVIQALPNLSKGHAILVSETFFISRHISYHTVTSVVYRYAAELGLMFFGDIEFHDWDVIEVRKPRVFRVKSEIDDYADDYYQVEPENCMLEYGDETHPSESGLYNVVLKDGRDMRMMYIPQEGAGLWILNHKCWNDMVQYYDATGPIVARKEDNEDGN